MTKLVWEKGGIYVLTVCFAQAGNEYSILQLNRCEEQLLFSSACEWELI